MGSRLGGILSRLPEQTRRALIVTPLSGGMTNQNYRLNRDGEAFVLRVFGDNTELLGIDRARERACTEIAAKTGVGAEVDHLIAGDDVLVTRFIDGATLAPAAAAEPATLKRIVRSIRRCHDGPRFPGSFSPFQDIRSYRRLALERGVQLPASHPAVIAQLDGIEAALGALTRLKPCHNDLLTSNLIDDGTRVWIIDWEFAGMGDPFFDLGLLAADADLDDAQRERLLHEYFGAVRERDVAHLRLMGMVADLREAFCPFLLSAISGLGVDYIAYGMRRYNRFLSQVHTPSFEDWLRLVRDAEPGSSHA
jgi:thiamine kinase-like enzyme